MNKSFYEKTLTMKLSKELHNKIKLNATAKGKSITNYILDLIEEDSKKGEYPITKDLEERATTFQMKGEK